MSPVLRPSGGRPGDPMIEFAPDLEELCAALPAASRRRLERFDRMLATDAAVRGYIARSPQQPSWQSHVLDSLAAVPLLDALLNEGAAPRIADVGSGAGLPGIPLAIARPSWRLTLLEERRGKVRLLERFLDELELENAQARKGDAARKNGQFDATVARALAPPSRALALCRGLVHEKGVVVLYLTDNQMDELSRCGGPEPLGVSGYRLPGLKTGRVAAAFPRDPASPNARIRRTD